MTFLFYDMFLILTAQTVASKKWYSFVEKIAWQDAVIAAAFIAGGMILGIIFDIFIVRTLHRIAHKSQWEWDDLVIQAFKRIPILWFTIGGLYAGLTYTFKPDPDIRATIKKIIFTILIFSITVVVARVVSGLIQLYSRKTKGGLPSTTLFSSVAKLLIIIAGIIIILQNLGISITPMITALGIGGLAVALALQDTLSNLFAGFQIIMSRQISTGDFVKLDTGESGYVTDVKYRNTTIKSLRSTQVYIVPNSKIASAIVTNYNMPRKLVWIRIPVGVAYDSDLEVVEKATFDTAIEVLKIFYDKEKIPEPVVRFREFGDSSINLSIRMPVRQYVDQFRLRHHFIKALHKKYNQEGIEIPFPIRTIHMADRENDNS